MSVFPESHMSLSAAARYVRAFRGKTFVFKLGGEVLEDGAARRAVCEQLNVLWSFSIRLVIVHGGGASIDALCHALGLPVEKVAGRRVTSEPVLKATKMALAGSVHTDLLAELRVAGLEAVGVSGVDAGLLTARKREPVCMQDDAGKNRRVDFGRVGDLERVNPALLTHLMDGGYVPVIAPLSVSEQGEVLNTNADTVAAEVAAALGAEKLFFLLNVPGLLEEAYKPWTLVASATLEDLREFQAQGRVSGGMYPKLAAVIHALTHGVSSAHLVSGQVPDAVLAEVFTNQGSGTMVVAEEPAVAEPSA